MPMPWLFAKGTSTVILPPVPLLSTQSTLRLYGYPRTLWSARVRLTQKNQTLGWWSLSRQSHCNLLGLLHISQGTFSLFGHIPVTENQISQLEKIALRNLRTSSCFLNFVPDIWGRLSCPTGRKGSMFVYFASPVQLLSPTLCDPMNRSTPGLPVHHQLPEFTQTHAHRVGDAIQPSHPLSSPSPPAPNPSQHQGLFL